MLLWNAPAAIIVHGKKGNDTIGFGCAIALHHAALMGETMNIGSCYNGLFQEAINRDKKIKEMMEECYLDLEKEDCTPEFLSTKN